MAPNRRVTGTEQATPCGASISIIQKEGWGGKGRGDEEVDALKGKMNCTWDDYYISVLDTLSYLIVITFRGADTIAFYRRGNRLRSGPTSSRSIQSQVSEGRAPRSSPRTVPISTIWCVDLEFQLFRILFAEEQLWVKAVTGPEEIWRHE